VLLANSITLTPGTITIDIEGESSFTFTGYMHVLHILGVHQK